MKIITVSFANKEVSRESYLNLVGTTKSNIEVAVFDNRYPGNNTIEDLCDELGFDYHSFGENMGMYVAYNYLLAGVTDKKVILHDGDHKILTDGWDEAISAVLDDPTVMNATLVNEEIERELNERGYTEERIKGVDCLIPQQAGCNTVCGFNTYFLKQNRLEGSHKYYGGNEVKMWPLYDQVETKWVYLRDFRENKKWSMDNQDWVYTQYKLLYAHKNLDMSFDEYVKTNPTKQNITL